MRLLDNMFIPEGQWICQEDNVSAILRLDASHPIFKAHFPGTPITPGVCLIQLIGELLTEATHTEMTLQHIRNLKYLVTISPLETPLISVNFQYSQSEGKLSVRGIIATTDGLPLTKFSLIFSPDSRQ